MENVTKSAVYAAAKRNADAKIVGRFSRRNVKLQNGVFTTDIRPLVKAGDEAMARLRSKFDLKKAG